MGAELSYGCSGRERTYNLACKLDRELVRERQVGCESVQLLERDLRVNNYISTEFRGDLMAYKLLAGRTCGLVQLAI